MKIQNTDLMFPSHFTRSFYILLVACLDKTGVMTCVTVKEITKRRIFPVTYSRQIIIMCIK
jgi:hypothetical protein